MTCKKTKRIIYTEKFDELDAAIKKEIELHLNKCTKCNNVFIAISNADKVITKIKNTVPQIRHANELTQSILNSIANPPVRHQIMSRSGKDSPIDYIAAFFSRPAIRFICCFFLLSCGFSYSIMEYNDTKAIVSLEQKLGLTQRKLLTEANIFYEEATVIRLMNDLYKFAQGIFSYEEFTNKLNSMNKEDAQILMEKHHNIDEPLLTRLDKLQSHFRTERELKLREPKNAKEINALRQEIQKLRKVLELYIGKDK